MTNEKKDRMLELLTEQVIFGLNNKELMELEQLKSQFPDLDIGNSLEAAAAAISLSNIAIVPLPESLRTKILANADDFFSPAENSKKVFYSPSAEVDENRGFLRQPFWQWLGWGIAAAACILLVVNLWLTRFQKPPEIVRIPEAVQTPTPELTETEKRAQLLTTAPDVVQTKLEPAKGVTDVSGNVVWSNSLQKGYVTFDGLPVNDPSKETYQLWIVDETQNSKTPINGGVFNVRKNGEIVIPIDVELQVKKPKMFAVTKEKPGGVVVSKQDNVVATAKI